LVPGLVLELGQGLEPALEQELGQAPEQHNLPQAVWLSMLPERWHQLVLTTFYFSLFPPIKILVSANLNI